MATWWKRALLILVVLGISYVLVAGSSPFKGFIGEWLRTESKIKIGGVHVAVQVMDTPKMRAQGLSGREKLSEREGMLFVFSEDDRHSFWMKDMRFPIDIVWLSQSGEVVDIQHSVSPDTYPTYSFAPQKVARYVLELSAGWTRRHGVGIGDRVEL